MNNEMDLLAKNQTWESTDSNNDTNNNAKAIPCKWVFRLKTNSDSSIDRFKARLIVK
jgi:hypothetical protein